LKRKEEKIGRKLNLRLLGVRGGEKVLLVKNPPGRKTRGVGADMKGVAAAGIEEAGE